MAMAEKYSRFTNDEMNPHKESRLFYIKFNILHEFIYIITQ